jgi:hypothetical protein
MTATSNTSSCQRVNDLLVNIARSLLQYAGEAWPWSSAADGLELRAMVRRLGQVQQQSVRDLANLLDGEGHAVDFGVYPDEYTSLHYVSLRYLIEQLVASERSLVADCQKLARDLEPGSPAAELLAEVGRREETILAELQTVRR